MSVGPKNLLTLTAQIVSAHIARNMIAAAELPNLIQQVHQVLSTVGISEELQKPGTALVPAVPVKRSVFPDHIVCLEDGKKLKILKRHLQSAYGMTPEDYRAKWSLPSSYPMVAPNYAERRSILAKQIGLGRTAETGLTAADALEDEEAGSTAEPRVQMLPERKRGRPRKAA